MICRLLALFLSFAVGVGCRQPDPSSRVDVAPPDACAVALAAGEQSTEHDRAIARLQEQVRTGSDRKHALEQLGYRYVARARVDNDAGDYKLAEKTAECMSSSNHDDPAAQLLRGHVLHQMHRFSEAEAIARQLTATREFPLDYGLLGDALMDQGRLDEAAAAYQRMIDLKPFYQSYTRAAHLRWLKGDLDGAIEMIRLAVQAASPRDRESVAWAYTRLAAYEMQRQRFDDAGRALDSALQYQPQYAAALLARGRLLAATQHAADSVAPLERAASLDPLPEYQWALADAYRIVGQSDDADRVERALTARGAELDPRTLALFLATRRTDVKKAMTLAERELETRSDTFTLDALAWALAADGRADEAGRAITRALAAGTKDGRLFLHAAVIADLQGQHREAREWIAKALALHTMLLPSELAELDMLRQRVAGRSN